MNRVRVAAILTSYNRREKTLASIRALHAQQGKDRFSIDIFLVDAGSSDGTAKAVRDTFQDTHLAEVSSDTFWNQGMIAGYELAKSSDPDFFFLLNDDTDLEQDALVRLLDTCSRVHSKEERDAIAVGATLDPDRHSLTYGGLVRRWFPIPSFQLVPAGTSDRRVDTMNCNCVLIPRSIVSSIGFLDSRYAHSKGDIDLGLRASADGIPVVTTPGTIGMCARNDITGTWRDPALDIRTRWQRLNSVKGVPFAEHAYFHRRNSGGFWPIKFALSYSSVLARMLLAPVIGMVHDRASLQSINRTS